LKWWQIRTTEYGLLLFPLIIQRVLVLPLWILAVAETDFNQTPLSTALDATYSGIYAPSAVKQIILMGWILLAVSAVSASLERCYEWPKTVLLYAGLTGSIALMTLDVLAVYEPYLAVRR